MTDDAVRRRIPVYAVVFSADVAQDDEYSPVLGLDEARTQDVTAPHGLDRDVVPALPALWYCLQLPRTALDVLSPSPWAVRQAQLVGAAHRIWLGPLSVIEAAADDPLGSPALVLSADGLIDETRERAAAAGYALPPTAFSGLSDASLASHWRALREFYGGKEGEDDPGGLVVDTLTAPVVVPLRHLARSLGGTRADADAVDPSSRDAVAAAVRWRGAVAGVAQMPTLAEPPDDADVDEAFGGAAGRERLPVAFVVGGVAPFYARRARPPAGADAPVEDGASDAAAEQSALALVAAHHAAAHDGLGLFLPDVPPEAFTALAQLEKHWAQKPNPRTVARLMDRLDAATSHWWTPRNLVALERASSLTVLSGFPVGLLRPPGGDAPLSCRLPVAYRPVMPLTRLLQRSMPARPPVNLTAGVRVLVAECLAPDDRIGPLSRRAWRTVATALERLGGGLTIAVEETQTPAALREAVDRHRPDLLVISAHGTLVGTNTAALVIGDRPSLGLDLGPMPPAVALSACHVAPRGRGEISVADMLLRQGALAVLGTLVPVDVRHNANLMLRLLLYIGEVLRSDERHATLLEVWHRVQGSNAIHDVIAGNERMHAWAMRGNALRPPMVEFKDRRSAGRVRLPTTYTDTVRVLREIAEDRGDAQRFDAWMAQGYLPESAFYAFLGTPDRIWLSRPGGPAPGGPGMRGG